MLYSKSCYNKPCYKEVVVYSLPFLAQILLFKQLFPKVPSGTANKIDPDQTAHCSSRSNLIWVYIVCICHFVRHFGVGNFRTFIIPTTHFCENSALDKLLNNWIFCLLIFTLRKMLSAYPLLSGAMLYSKDNFVWIHTLYDFLNSQRV